MTPRRLGVAFLNAILATSACGSHRGSSASRASTGPEGSVVGRIHACIGLGYATPQYVGGTVVVLRGQVRSVRVSPGVGKTVFPTKFVARRRVATGGHFHFALPPGHYVIELPRYAGDNVGTWASVTIRSHTTLREDLPNMCL